MRRCTRMSPEDIVGGSRSIDPPLECTQQLLSTPNMNVLGDGQTRDATEMTLTSDISVFQYLFHGD